MKNFFFSPTILAIIVSLSLVATLFSSQSVCAAYHTRTRSLPPRSSPPPVTGGTTTAGSPTTTSHSAYHTTLRTKTRSLPPRFSYVRRTRTQSPVSYSPPSTTTTGTLIQCPGVHKCKWYRCIDNIYKCSTKAGIEQRDRFLINYGQKFCNIATNIQSSLSHTAQIWTTNARQCLQNTLVSKVNQDQSRRQLSCTEITNAAFASHVPCYINNGFCMLPKYDQFKILKAVKGGLLNSRSAIKTTLKIVTRCGVQLAIKAITVKVLTRMTFTAISVAFGRVYVRVRVLAMGYLLRSSSSTAAGDLPQNRYASSLSSSNSSSSFSYVVLISPADGENSTDPLGDIATFNETSTTNFTALSSALATQGITLVTISSTSVTDVNDTCEQSGLVASSSSNEQQCISSPSSSSQTSASFGGVATVAAGVSLVVIIIVIVVVAYHQKLGVFNKNQQQTDSKQETA